ncbi:MAG: TRIC cation channel family protein, partial [Sphingomicrobium sp.]
MTDPVATTLPFALEWLDYFGIAVFAVSGALLAAEKKQTLVTFLFFAVVTGVGGGTLRDLLIGAPVFWVHGNATLLICIGAAALVWLVGLRWLSG